MGDMSPPTTADYAQAAADKASGRIRDLERRVAELERARNESGLWSDEEIRAMLSNCVTAVTPGETLIVRVPLAWTTSDVWEYQERLTAALEFHGMPFKALVVPAAELGVAQAPEPGDG